MNYAFVLKAFYSLKIQKVHGTQAYSTGSLETHAALHIHCDGQMNFPYKRNCRAERKQQCSHHASEEK